METIKEAKQYLRDNFKTGVECPCCTQRVQLYKFSISSGQTVGLIELYKLDKQKPNEYFNIRDIEKYKQGFGGGAFAKVKHWELAVDKINDDTGKRTSGMWAITDKGRKFVEGKILLPKYAKLYNQKRYGFDNSELVNIREALGTKFNYEELMNYEKK